MSYDLDAAQKGIRKANDEIIAMKQSNIKERDDKQAKLLHLLLAKGEKIAEIVENKQFKSLSHYDTLTRQSKIASAQSVIMDKLIQFLASI